jgi:K+-transporting ATPase ATPase B chain
MLIFGGGGVLVPFIGIKLIDIVITPLVRILNIG